MVNWLMNLMRLTDNVKRSAIIWARIGSSLSASYIDTIELIQPGM